MFEQIRKRDGSVVVFDPEKIISAIARAGKATGEFDGEQAIKLTDEVLTLAHKMEIGPIPKVEQVQDVVEEVLLASQFCRTAKAYILYREQHAQTRDIMAKANVELVENYLEGMDWKIKENSNMTFSLQGLNNFISSEVTSVYWLNRTYPREIRQAHKDGDFHIHDLGLLAVYCVGWDLKDLLLKGFRGLRARWRVPQRNISDQFSARSSISSTHFRVRQREPKRFLISIPSLPLLCATTVLATPR